MKVVAACGNGTAGAFAPQMLERLGCEVMPLDVELDYTFPRYNPNPEDMDMLHAIADKVRETGADVGLGFDGDGDRCGVVDNNGDEIFADKIGVMLARDLSKIHPNASFVVDVKSTGLFATDPELVARGVDHRILEDRSFLHQAPRQRAARRSPASKSRGTSSSTRRSDAAMTTALLTAVHVLEMLDRNPTKSMAELYAELPKTWGSPTMSPHCDDEKKYGVVDKVTARIEAMRAQGEQIIGQPIRDVVTVNGVRVTVADGTWGLVRASSNKPELVVVVESPVSQARMKEMFTAIDAVLRENPEVGAYNQTI